VKSRPLDGWRETLAMLCAYSKTEEFAGLCDALARRLAGVGLTHAATMSWICAGNVEKAVRHWEKTVDLADPQQLQVGFVNGVV
jgi:protein transport protein SEC31